MDAGIRQSILSFMSGIMFCLAVATLLWQLGRIEALKSAIAENPGVSVIEQSSAGTQASSGVQSASSAQESMTLAEYASMVSSEYSLPCCCGAAVTMMIADTERTYDIYVDGQALKSGGNADSTSSEQVYAAETLYLMKCSYNRIGELISVDFTEVQTDEGL